jgi:hypothetical protein
MARRVRDGVTGTNSPASLTLRDLSRKRPGWSDSYALGHHGPSYSSCMFHDSALSRFDLATDLEQSRAEPPRSRLSVRHTTPEHIDVPGR